MAEATFNRLGNIRNKYQTTATRVLAVCSAGLLRSPTVANVLHEWYGHNTRAAGWCAEYALIPLDEVLLSWADEIVFVSQDSYDNAAAEFADVLARVRAEKIILDIPDRFEWNHPELRRLIVEQYEARRAG